MVKDMKKGVLIIGSGVGGLKAALEVATRGTQVYLIDRSPFFGGEIVQLERQFPTNRCCLCYMLPTTNRVEEGEYCLRRDFYHPLIELIPGAELTDFSGKAGNFKTLVRKRARGVTEELCTGCQKCIEVWDHILGALPSVCRPLLQAPHHPLLEGRRHRRPILGHRLWIVRHVCG